MGILPSHLHLLAMEQTRIRGDVLTLGLQSVWGNLKEVKQIMQSHNIKLNKLPPDFNIKNKIPHWKGTFYDTFTNVDTVLKLLGADNTFSADYSDYENPDLIVNLNYEVEKSLYHRFDCILDGGTLEHVFNIPTALKNIANMLKPGGNVIHILPSSNAIDHGFYSFSPTLFFDFFSNNGFSNFSCYLREGSSFNYFKKGKLYKYEYVGGEYTITSKKVVEVIFCATKNIDCLNSNNIVKPIQHLYAKGIYLKKTENKVSLIERIYYHPKFTKTIQKILFITRHFRPEFIDVIYHRKIRKRNLTYLGKF